MRQAFPGPDPGEVLRREQIPVESLGNAIQELIGLRDVCADFLDSYTAKLSGDAAADELAARIVALRVGEMQIQIHHVDVTWARLRVALRMEDDYDADE